MSQNFLGDVTELKFRDSLKPIVDQLSGQKTLFFTGLYECFALGDLLYENKLAPLTNAIPQAIFRESFPAIFNAFVFGGTFDAYLLVFRSVFGDDVEVDFTIPGPGMLQIDIVATGLVLSNFVARRIVSNAYVFDNVLTQDGDQIVFQTVKGFQSQYDLEQMLFELVPAGVKTDINLTVGS